MGNDDIVEKVNLNNTWVSRLMPGVEIFARIKEIMKELGVERIVILSAIGSLRDVVMRDLKEEIKLPVVLAKTNSIKAKGPFELLSMEGTVVPFGKEAGIHLHVMIGASDGRVIGGHLFSATCFTTVEIIFSELKNSRVVKVKNEDTGLNEMTLM
ncbi:MAG: DNA-binding protein [Planctomycetes bacterium]|nr:DNA-binding protein [Planctomycetota bacterium]